MKKKTIKDKVEIGLCIAAAIAFVLVDPLGVGLGFIRPW